MFHSLLIPYILITIRWNTIHQAIKPIYSFCIQNCYRNGFGHSYGAIVAPQAEIGLAVVHDMVAQNYKSYSSTCATLSRSVMERPFLRSRK